jgi:hypothetical protein
MIKVTFSESMNTMATEGAFSITPPGVTGSTGWDSANTTMTFTPDADLEYGTQYTVTVGAGATSLAGIQMQDDFTWNFTTIETVSITILADPLDFGNPSAGTVGQPATGSPSITIVNNGTSTVGVYLKATDFTGDSWSIPVGNIFFYESDDFGSALTMSNDYGTSAWQDLEPGKSLDIYHWLSVPGGTPPGDYSANFTYKAE